MCTAARRRSAGRRGSSLLGSRRTSHSGGIPHSFGGRPPPRPALRFRCAAAVLSVRRAVPPDGVWDRILDASLPESLESELAGVANAAGLRPAMVAGRGESPGNAEALALADDVRLRHVNEGRADLDHVPLDAAFRTKSSDFLEGGVEFRAAIDVAGKVNGVRS